jgi:hypothetical protein
MSRKQVWIFESSEKPVTLIKEDNGTYIFEGLAADFERNENGRLYKKDDYLEKMESLQERIKKGSLFGETDHPERYNVLVAEASHVIRELRFDEATDTVRIKIELFDNAKGNHLKGIADKGCPLFISSRASGYIDDDGNVILEKIYTYDAVYEPGFKNAELTRLNESLGLNSRNVLVYEMREINTTSKQSQKVPPMTNTNSESPTNIKEYQEKTAKIVEGMQQEITNLTKIINEGKSTPESGKIMQHLTALSTNFNGAMDVFESQSQIINKLSSHLNLAIGTVNQIVEWSNTIDHKISSLKNKQVSIAEHTNIIANIVNENMDEAAGDIAQLKKYHNITANSVNEMMSVEDRMAKHINLLVESVNEDAETQERLISHVNALTVNTNEMVAVKENLTRLATHHNGVVTNVNKLTELYDITANTINESVIAGKDMIIEGIIGKENKYIGNVICEGVQVGTISFDKSGYNVTVDAAYAPVADKIKSSATLRTAFESIYNDKFKVPYSLTESLKASNNGNISRTVDEAIFRARKTSAQGTETVIETKFPFYRILSNDYKAKFASMSESKQTRVATEVIAKTLLKQPEIENAIGVISSFDDTMILLESHLTGEQVTKWSGLPADIKENVYSMFHNRNIVDKISFDAFFESLDLRSQKGITLNEQKEQKQDVGDFDLLQDTRIEPSDEYADRMLNLI